MKNSILALLALALFSCQSETQKNIELSNDSALDLIDEGITLTPEDLGISSDEKLPYILDEEGNKLASQLDDLDMDGSWDELFFLVDLKAGERKTLIVKFVNEDQYPSFDARTNIRFANKKQNYKEVDFAVREEHATNTITQEVWQMEGIAWENDFIAFRNYFDRRNGMDIFGKVTTKMVLDSVGDATHHDYHAYNPSWGVDVLKVGNSLGAGSIAFEYNDSLYRVGDNGKGTCQVISDGPVRSIFKFEFENWEMGPEVLQVENTITIQAGKRYYESEVIYTGTDAPLKLVTGIVNKKSKVLHEINGSEAYVGFYTHDLQSEDTTLLGMGILVPTAAFIETGETEKLGNGITETYTMSMKTAVSSPLSYRFYTVWEREDAAWKDAANFGAFLQEEAEKASHPVEVTIK